MSLRLLADDLTGALDTAAELVGLTGPVRTYWHGAVPQTLPANAALDSGTRELKPAPAAAIVIGTDRTSGRCGHRLQEDRQPAAWPDAWPNWLHACAPAVGNAACWPRHFLTRAAPRGTGGNTRVTMAEAGSRSVATSLPHCGRRAPWRKQAARARSCRRVSASSTPRRTTICAISLALGLRWPGSNPLVRHRRPCPGARQARDGRLAGAVAAPDPGIVRF